MYTSLLILLLLITLLPLPCIAEGEEFHCFSEIAVYSIQRERQLRSCGVIASLDQLGSDEFLTYRLQLTYNGTKRLTDQQLEVSVDGGPKWGWAKMTFDPGSSFNCHVYYSNMQHCMTEGAHTVTWYLNGKPLHTKSFSFTRDVPWAQVFQMPSKEEIARVNQTSTLRSPYIAGWASIPAQQTYSACVIDFKADHVPHYTYLCPGNMFLDMAPVQAVYPNARLADGPSFYAGVQDAAQGRIAIMSFWDILYDGPNGSRQVIHAKRIYPDNPLINQPFSGEGNGIQTLDRYDWEPHTWYRMLMRCITSQENGNTVVELWFQNLKTQRWTLFCQYDTGVKNTLFKGSFAFFLENYAPSTSGDIRTMELANIRIYDDAKRQWLPVTSATIGPSGSFFPQYQGSYAIGTAGDRFYMITSGAGGSVINSDAFPPSNKYTVNGVQQTAPY